MNVWRSSSTPTSTGNYRRFRRWGVLPLPILLIAGGLWLHFTRLHEADHSPPPVVTPWALQTGRVELGRVGNVIEAIAVVEAPNIIVLSPRLAGTVLAVGPRAGSVVKRGQILVRLDVRTLQEERVALRQERRAASAEAAYRDRQYRRIEAVLADGGISRSRAEKAYTEDTAARAKVWALTARIDAIEVKLGYAVIRAPFDARVARRLVAVGDTVGPGEAVYRLTAGRGAVVRVALPSAQLARVRPGNLLVLRQGGRRLRLLVSRIAPAVDAAGLGFVEAEANTDPFGLPSGATVTARLLVRRTASALTVPVAALIGNGREAHVFAYIPAQRSNRPGHLQRVNVTVLRVGSRRAAVQGELRRGERVVVGETAFLGRLHNGDAAWATPFGERP